MGGNMKRVKKKEVYGRLEDLQKAVKLNCYGCMGGQKKIDCGIEECALFPFRPFGKDSK
jgi:hypothetical protein